MEFLYTFKSKSFYKITKSTHGNRPYIKCLFMKHKIGSLHRLFRDEKNERIVDSKMACFSDNKLFL